VQYLVFDPVLYVTFVRWFWHDGIYRENLRNRYRKKSRKYRYLRLCSVINVKIASWLKWLGAQQVM